MSNNIDDPGHGHSPAAWTAVVIMLLAVSLGTLFYFFDMPVLVWASAGLLVVALGWHAVPPAPDGLRHPRRHPRADLAHLRNTAARPVSG